MTEPERRTLALDLGDARIGLALSDPLGLTAQPAGVLRRKNAAADLAAIRSIVEEHDVARVVVGHPLLLSGVPGARALAAEKFAAKLRIEFADVEVELWDERLTTSEAERVLVGEGVRRSRRREVIDAMAAALILQGWLDSRRGAFPEVASRPGQPSE